MPEPSTMASDLALRLYRPADRDAVRRICCDTADRGGPVEQFFDDREIFSDLLMGYYAAYEPGSLWVAESQGRVVGYLTGCVDSGRYARLMAWRVVPAAVWRALRRGTFGFPRSWRLGLAGVRTWWLGGRPPRYLLRTHPAHFHINLEAGIRGQRIGRQLVARFLEQARAAGIRGVHASVRADNPRACRFFESLGFVELSRAPVVFPSGEAYHRHDTIIYGAQL